MRVCWSWWFKVLMIATGKERRMVEKRKKNNILSIRSSRSRRSKKSSKQSRSRSSTIILS